MKIYYIMFVFFLSQSSFALAATSQKTVVQQKKTTMQQKTATQQKSVQKTKKVMEKTFALIKPSGMPIATEIKSIINSYGLKIIKSKKITMSEQLFDELYFMHKDRPFFNDLKLSIVNKQVEVMVLYGEKAVERYRMAVDFIRNKYSFMLNKTDNAVHGSDSNSRAKEEICIFFKTEC